MTDLVFGVKKSQVEARADCDSVKHDLIMVPQRTRGLAPHAASFAASVVTNLVKQLQLFICAPFATTAMYVANLYKIGCCRSKLLLRNTDRPSRFFAYSPNVTLIRTAGLGKLGAASLY